MDFSSGRKLNKEGKESMASARVHASSHRSSLLCFSDGEYNYKRRDSKHAEYKTHSMGNIYSRLSKNGLNAQGRVRGNGMMNAPFRARENGVNSPIGARENGVARVKDDRESFKRDWCRSPSRINSRCFDVDKELGEISSGSSAEDVGYTFNSLSNGCSEVRKRDLTRKRKNSCSPNTEDDRPLSVDEGKAEEIIVTPHSSDKEDVFVLPNIAASRWADVDSPCNGQDRKKTRLSSDRGGPDETDDSARPNIAVSRWVDIDSPCKNQEKDRVRISSVLSGGGCNSLSSDSQESIICQLDGLQVSSLCSDSDGGQAGGSCGTGKIERCNDCEFDHRQSLDLDKEDVFENEFCGSESHVILTPGTPVSPCLSAVPVGRRIDMLQGCRSVDEFMKLNRINEGTYGVVYRARDIKSGEIVALKKVKMERERDGFPMSALREINVLLSLHHPCVVNVKEVVVGSNDLDDIFMVMEYMEHDLKGFMESMKQPFSLSEIKSLMLQLLEGVSYLHDNWVLHRDLKTSNLLLNNKGDLKMCDFGMARQYSSPLKTYTHMVVTLWYRAPELLLGAKKYSTAVDMWSVGCIMAELLAKEPLFRGKSEIDQLDKIFRTLGTPNEKIWPDFVTLTGVKCNFVKQPYNKLREKFPAVSFSARPTLSEAGFDLINHLLTYDPDKRISSEEALNHEWFRELPLPKSKEHYVDAFTSE